MVKTLGGKFILVNVYEFPTAFTEAWLVQLGSYFKCFREFSEILVFFKIQSVALFSNLWSNSSISFQEKDNWIPFHLWFRFSDKFSFVLYCTALKYHILYFGGKK